MRILGLVLAAALSVPALAQDAPPLDAPLDTPLESADAASVAAPAPKVKRLDKQIVAATGAIVLPNATVSYRLSEESSDGARRESDLMLWTLGRCLRLHKAGMDVWLDLGSGVMKTEPKVELKKDVVSGELARILELVLDAASEGAPDKVAGVPCKRAFGIVTHSVGKIKDTPVTRQACWSGRLPLAFAMLHDKDIIATLPVEPALPVKRVGTAQSVAEGKVLEAWVRPPGETLSCER